MTEKIPTSEEKSILDKVIVLEIAEGVSGPVCGLQLADLGAIVIKVEPPEGDRTREWGPPLASGSSAIFEHLNRGKRSLVLDLDSEDGREGLEALLPKVDVVVVQQDPQEEVSRGIDWDSLVKRFRQLLICKITDLGEKGPLSGLAGSELILQALSGYTRYITEAGKEPMRIGYEVGCQAAAMHAVQAVLAGLFWRAQSGEGQIVRIPALGALLSVKSTLLAAQTDPDTWEGFHLNGANWPADTGWLTKDGQVTFDFLAKNRDGWAAFCKAIGLERLIDDPDYKDWRSTIGLGDRRFTYGEVYRQIFASMKSAEVSGLINKLGGMSMKFNDYEELLAHPQFRFLDTMVKIPEAPLGAQTQMGTPFKLSDAQVDRGSRPAPHLGECTLEEAEKVCAPSRGKKTRAQGANVSIPTGRMLPGPLAGLKVLDASQGGVGPWAGVLLGVLGADVVKLESPQGDFSRAVKPTQRGFSTTYMKSNLNKRGIVLDMKQEADQQKVYGFVKQADVFIENFRPGTADRIGFGYEKLSRLNPRLVYASASGYGLKGPLAGVGGLDPHIQAFSGSTCVNGRQGGLRERMRCYLHIDLNTALVMVQGVLTALLECQQHTGKGQRVDVTMTQATMALQRVRLSEYLGGGNPVPMGSGTTYLVPDQAFATQDRYIAVSATNRAQWQALCTALGAAQLSNDPRFATNPARIENREILIPMLAERFLARPAGYWIRVLGKAGVPCSLFMNFNDYRHHIHYLENEFIIALKTAHWGDLILGGLPWRFSKTPGSLRSGSEPGEFTEEIVKGNWPDPKPGS